MINKRLLIKNLLSHNDESSFYDKKRSIDLSSKEGKAKFLKHICALSNSNPENNSFIVIGVEDGANEMRGVDFFDDSKIQNLVNAYLSNAPLIIYENIAFPNLPNDKVVGLVTIRPNGMITSLRKNIWKYWGGSIFLRDGSISMPKDFDIEIKDVNSKIVQAIENKAKNNIALTLDGVMDFMNHRHDDLESHYKVFKELFVLCWAGNSKKHKAQTYYSRVDIELINERLEAGELIADIRVCSSKLKGINIPERLVPLAIDEFPAIFIAASCAKGETVLTGAKELRVKESDRIQVMADGLSSLGIENEVLDDGIKIVGGEFKEQLAPIKSHHDHRISMSFAVASVRSSFEINIDGVDNVKTSFPNFVELANSIGMSIIETN